MKLMELAGDGIWYHGSSEDFEYILEPEVYDNGVKSIDVNGGISSIEVDSDGQWILTATREIDI